MYDLLNCCDCKYLELKKGNSSNMDCVSIFAVAIVRERTTFFISCQIRQICNILIDAKHLVSS